MPGEQTIFAICADPPQIAQIGQIPAEQPVCAIFADTPAHSADRADPCKAVHPRHFCEPLGNCADRADPSEADLQRQLRKLRAESPDGEAICERDSLRTQRRPPKDNAIKVTYFSLRITLVFKDNKPRRPAKQALPAFLVRMGLPFPAAHSAFINEPPR